MFSIGDIVNTVFPGAGSALKSLPTVPELTGQEAAKDAARQQRASTGENIALQREMWQTSRKDLAPYREAGTRALGRLEGMRMPSFSLEDFYASPDYQFRLQQGRENVLAGAGAGGMRLSGRTLEALMGLGQGMASAEYGNWYGRRMGESQDEWNRQAQLAGIGQGATSQAVGANQAATQNIMQQNQALANANAAASMQGYYGMQNLIGQGMWGAGLAYLLSDERAKEGIEPESLGLDFVNSLRPVRFRYKGEDIQHEGLIAQELKTALDDAGVNSAMHYDGELQAINYAEVVPVLIKAVQELSAKVEAMNG